MEELGELAVVPLMLKKQPDIVTTIRFELINLCFTKLFVQETEEVHWPSIVLQLA